MCNYMQKSVKYAKNLGIHKNKIAYVCSCVILTQIPMKPSM